LKTHYGRGTLQKNAEDVEKSWTSLTVSPFVTAVILTVKEVQILRVDPVVVVDTEVAEEDKVTLIDLDLTILILEKGS